MVLVGVAPEVREHDLGQKLTDAFLDRPDDVEERQPVESLIRQVAERHAAHAENVVRANRAVLLEFDVVVA